ncbi:MAG: hypothetical protein R2877_03610 [Bdellovibrionota bacterium]
MATTGPLYNPNSPNQQQAQFAGAGATGNEEVTLNNSSTPEIDNCEYHVILTNYSGTTVDYELTITLEGDTPRLKANFDPQRKIQDGKTTLVPGDFPNSGRSVPDFIRQGEDTGIESIANVSEARIYEDTNNNGRVDAADTLLSQTSNIDSATKTFTFSNEPVHQRRSKGTVVDVRHPRTANASATF